MFNTFQCKNLRDYHDLYLKTDVLVLTDIFMAFRRLTLSTYQLDALHYYTLPGMCYDALLLQTKAELELFTDPDMYAFMESGIRGGVSSINHRLAEPNNKYMGDRYDPSKESSYIIDLDFNNLYGYCMEMSLPVGKFQWINENQFDDTLKNIMEVKEDSKIGYIFQVDLEYPAHLHDLHSSLPLAPEKLSIPYSVNSYIMAIFAR